jgi:hypothetical protein
MTEVRLTSEEYEKLYSVYVCASNLVSHKDEFELKELNEWHIESKRYGLEQAVNNFKQSI